MQDTSAPGTNWLPASKKLIQQDHSIGSKQDIQTLFISASRENNNTHKVQCRDIKNMTELAKRGMYDRTQLL